MEHDLKNKETDIPQKKKKSKKSTLALIINIITGIVVVLALVFTIQAFYARKHLHNNYFGYAVLPVETDSMRLENGGKDNFKRGDLIFVELLSADEKRNLEVGDVITFKFFNFNEDAESLNTHRIIEVRASGYVTQGDAIVEQGDKPTEHVSYDSVVGVFKGKVGVVGHVSLFMQQKAGMFIMIVVPFILLLLVSIFYFIRNFREYSKEKTEDATESAIMSERERLRQEIFAEMQRTQQTSAPGGSQSAPLVQPEEMQVDEMQVRPEAEPVEDASVEPEAEQKEEPVPAAKPKTTKSTNAKSTATKSTAAKSTAAKSTTAKTSAAKKTTAKTPTGKKPAPKSNTAKTATKSTATKTSTAKKNTTTKPKQ